MRGRLLRHTFGSCTQPYRHLHPHTYSKHIDWRYVTLPLLIRFSHFPGKCTEKIRKLKNSKEKRNENQYIMSALLEGRGNGFIWSRLKCIVDSQCWIRYRIVVSWVNWASFESHCRRCLKVITVFYPLPFLRTLIFNVYDSNRMRIEIST